MMKPWHGRWIFLAMLATTPLSHAGEKNGTVFLKDADRYVGKAPLIPKTEAEASPTVTPKLKPSATATPTPVVTSETPSDGEDNAVASGRAYPPAVIRRSVITVGTQVPVPTGYAPPQVVSSAGGGFTVVPATPNGFGTVRTGTVMGSGPSGGISVSDTELAGFVNYGSPIRAVVPVYDTQGRPVGAQAVTISPNSILVPVTTTVEIRR